MIEPILERARADPDGLADDLASLHPDMDTDALEERLARVLFVADLWGALTVGAGGGAGDA